MIFENFLRPLLWERKKNVGSESRTEFLSHIRIWQQWQDLLVPHNSASLILYFFVGLFYVSLTIRYFKGDIKIGSVHGHGTDVYVYLQRLSSLAQENLPVYNAVSSAKLTNTATQVEGISEPEPLFQLEPEQLNRGVSLKLCIYRYYLTYLNYLKLLHLNFLNEKEY